MGGELERKMSGKLENINPVVSGKLRERVVKQEEEEDDVHDLIDAREVFGKSSI